MKAGFVPDPFCPRRRPTREVKVGPVGVGGAHPLRVQSMTTTDTKDTAATVDQAERLAAAGCEIVRITAPSIKDAENLGPIAKELRRRGVTAPLVADIHYTPNAALEAALHVEKVRVNPGNYADKKRFEVREYTDDQYEGELHRVRERFRPLVRRLRELGRSLRIGTNHGSLSDRIMNRFGDTPAGMVESALEFLDVCEEEGYRDVVFSMKASNPQVAIHAYRLLAARLEERAPGLPSYPFHVGVTEAGDGEDGRIKSAIGIGALLEDGIGDTIRVSLTEDPVREVPVAAALARHYERRWAEAPELRAAPGAPFVDDPYAHARRVTRPLGSPALGGEHPVRVEVELGPVPDDVEMRAREVAEALARVPDLACEGLLVDAFDPGALAALPAFGAALAEAGVEAPLGARAEADFAAAGEALPVGRIVVCAGTLVTDEELRNAAGAAKRAGLPLEWELRGGLRDLEAVLDRTLDAGAAEGLEAFAVSCDADLPVHAARLLAARLRARGARDVPIVLRHRRQPQLAENGEHGAHGDEEALLRAAVDLGAPLCDGIGDAVALSGVTDPGRALSLAYRILQGARQRTSWTEFISCPSCGRTLFDLEETTARIKARTGHLKGVKIAIMGCIVNGPGEMADADFGYVGSGPGRVNLYVGKELVVRNVPDTEADERLVDLIRQHGGWVEPG